MALLIFMAIYSEAANDSYPPSTMKLFSALHKKFATFTGLTNGGLRPSNEVL
jgi:hypothetical protein